MYLSEICSEVIKCENTDYVKCFYFLFIINFFDQMKHTLNCTVHEYYIMHHVILFIVSGGYYGFDFVTPPPPQCVETFHRYRSNEKNIIASLLKFAGYIHNHKILPGNVFGLILKNKMAATGVFRL